VTCCTGALVTLLALDVFATDAISRYTSDKDLARVAASAGTPRTTVAYRVRPFSFQFYTGWKLVYHVPVDDVRRALYEPGATLVLTEERWAQHLEDVAPGIELRALRQNPRHVLYSVVAPWSEDPSQARLPTDSRLLR